MRNCRGDEGRSFGGGDQELIPNHRKQLVVKSHGSERYGKVGAMIPAGQGRTAL
ncbi:MAG: hypothetical protein AAFW82_00095 [Pseudomonadota bacterium]